MNTPEKNILILHAHNTFNNGSFMMLINFITYFSEPSHAQYRFHVELQTGEDLHRLKEQTNDNYQIERLRVNITSTEKTGFAEKLRSLRKKLFSHITHFESLNISAIIILGGDDLSEYYKGWQVVSDLYRMKRYSARFPVFLVGQTIGPFRSWRIPVAAWCLKNTTLYFRDAVSMNLYTQAIGAGNIRLGADLALLDLPHHPEYDAVAHLKLKPDQYITLVPSGFYQLYCTEKKVYLNCWREIVLFMLTHPLLKEFKLLFLPHVTRPEDDRNIITELIALIPEQHQPRLVFENREYSPDIARMLIGASYFTLSGRMHAIVSSLQQLKPAIPLSYSLKFEGVIGQALKQSTLIVDASKHNAWTEGSVVNATTTKVDYLMNHYREMQQALAEILHTQQNLALKQIHDISSEIRNC